ncbi:MAG: DegT/DnrJ/EryC1/StrS family aminotransferase [Desulfobacteraceae bacterium]
MMQTDSNPKRKFSKNFTLQEPISEKGIEKALDVLRSGKLHRYNVESGEKSETSLLEEEFAGYMGSRYCLACASCGSAMYLAMKSAGIRAGEKVLCNAYTLAPVPGAIENTGARIELVEIEEDYTIDLADLESKAGQENVHWLLLSHMRGHIANMDKIMRICRENGISLIEDCAHTMGAEWDGRKSGSFGVAACFSTQTYKHMNSGEGGLLVTDDQDLMAKAVIYSGSYMNYDRHSSIPPLGVFEKYKKRIPNYSCRMDNLRAAILRPQIAELDRQCRRWNERYIFLESALNSIDGIMCPKRDSREYYVGSSVQFTLETSDHKVIQTFLEKCSNRGVELKWFGNAEPAGFTSSYSSWEYIGEIPHLPKTDRILSRMCDMRIPLTFDLEDCRRISEIISDVANEVLV